MRIKQEDMNRDMVGTSVERFARIEDHLDALATDSDLPIAALRACTTHIAESAPALLAVLTKAAEGDTLTEAEATLLFRGLHILGAARHRQAFRPLLQLLRLSEQDLEELLGDAITETLPGIVAGVFDGDAEALFATIEDTAIDEFVRSALLGAATLLTWKGGIERGSMEEFLRGFDDARAELEDHIWVAWLEAVALLGLRSLVPSAHSALRSGRVPTDLLDEEHFESIFAEAEQAPADPDRFQRAYLGYIDDVVGALEAFRYPDEVPKMPPRPVLNPYRHVGRNDLCPCGSGRKSKRCCLR